MVTMYRRSCGVSPNALRSTEMCWVRFASSTKVSGQTLLSKTSLETVPSRFWIRTSSVSNDFCVSGTGWPSRKSRARSESSRKGPNSYAGFISGEPIGWGREFRTFHPQSDQHSIAAWVQSLSTSPSEVAESVAVGSFQVSSDVFRCDLRTFEGIRGQDEFRSSKRMEVLKMIRIQCGASVSAELR